MKDIVKREIQADPNTLFLPFDCLHHAASLMRKTSLLLTDSFLQSASREWKYFSSVAKVVNIWRANAKIIFAFWSRSYGSLEAMQQACKLPPRCLSGRWNSVSETEKFILSKTAGHFVAAMKHAVQKLQKRPLPDEEGGGGRGDPDDLRVEEQQAYAVRMGRWGRECLETLADPLFWMLAQMSRKVRICACVRAAFVSRNCREQTASYPLVL
eukprot:15472003-Alexandrium_andersonii.AAC.1